MNTAEIIEAITEREKFELLVTSVLRKRNKDYEAIIHTGMNAQGETIKSPVDGFCQVPGSIPTRFLYVAHTTTDRDGLEKKWLHDHTKVKQIKNDRKTNPSESDDGDLLKAARLAQNDRHKFPDAKFTVILTTNQRLDLELLTKIYEKAKELEVEVEFCEQSYLADFLDNNAEGHWLRKKYLGIEAEMLSESLLLSLCKQSLANYEKQLGFLTSPDSWVYREVDSLVEKGKQSNAYTIQLLIGESGSGKSATAYQMLKKHLAPGGYGLWVSDELLKECTSLENALDKVLRSIYPSLQPDAGSNALKLIPRSSRLLLVVDDVNRADNPTRVLQNIINWSKPQSSGESNLPPLFSPCFVVCPVWTKVSNPISPDFKEIPWVERVFIGFMNTAEGIEALRAITLLANVDITSTEASSLAVKLGNDPILIGLFGSLLSNTHINEWASLTENVIERFITTSIEELSSSGRFLANESQAALSTLVTHMLTKRKLYPLWTEIKDWLQESSDDLDALRELIRHKKLCSIQEDKFVFRHDRIQETLLVESMIKLLSTPNLNSDIFEEPFYAEIIGKAIIRSQQNQEFLRELGKRLPLALIEAIRDFGTPTNNYHQLIIEEVMKWVNSSISTGLVPESVFSAVCRSLGETESSALLEITETFPKDRLVLLARLRNGCTMSGVRYCINENKRYFAPFTQDPWRDQALEQVKRYHKEKFLVELKQLLQSDIVTDEERAGALTLAGFLCFTELEDEIATCWELVIKKAQVLPIAIWASMRCCGAEPKKLLDPLMEYWANLSDEKNQFGSSFQNYFVDMLRGSLARGIRDHVIKYLILQYDVHKSLNWYIVRIVDLIDTPDVIEFIVKGAVDLEKSLAGTGNISTLMFNIIENWDNSSISKRKLSQASLDRLKFLWDNSASEEALKIQAFRLWLTGAELEQIDVMQGITSDSILFEYALEKRIKLGDRSVVPRLQTIQGEYIHHVWCDEILFMVDNCIETFKKDISKDFLGGNKYIHRIFSSLLIKIRVEDAENLLVKHWDYLMYSPLFIQSALCIGTPKCLDLAAAAINQCPKDIKILEHIHSHYEFAELGEKKPLTKQHLNNLLPYLDRLGQSDLWECAELCQTLKIPEWSQQYIAPLLSEENRKRYHPLDDDLLQELDDIATRINSDFHIECWLENFNKRHEPKNRVLGIIDHWLAINPTVKGLQIAAACVQAVGTRKDLSILDKYLIEGSPDEIARIKESTIFAVYRQSLD
ncbi:hypothetical protein Cylst_2061 [Cylindrospermum stagnale PCC 7417]|uniref:Uncharacterized protein n=1 Tax=Cylindrospermum stagnale PCC 7417 TaxID=56107 RepID=K9WVR2_9NOST|nr:ATP-binding protein [Cylindrospermum stagnale]AFZ24303.1 hypothetical protein Cylst_2061 [Cylindrospermum stagnale PCC 7417]